ncbi:unnamed protein product [Phytophthora lilii]|uniref:Unnamed protein product n=1 Tax=Phytophthora lilii TaxID=2077276 RepID=A0A9W6TEP0_9STRA|nr:unnamed protein product [Phytophthora lilii]
MMARSVPSTDTFVLKPSCPLEPATMDPSPLVAGLVVLLLEIGLASMTPVAASQTASRSAASEMANATQNSTSASGTSDLSENVVPHHIGVAFSASARYPGATGVSRTAKLLSAAATARPHKHVATRDVAQEGTRRHVAVYIKYAKS